MRIHRLACELGLGLLAGLAGTAAITASQALEMALTGRKPSQVTVKAAEKVLDIVPKDPGSAWKLSQAVHWSYGTAWGEARSLLGLAGVRGLPASLAHAVAIQAGAMTLLPAMRLAPPVTQWGAKSIAVDGVHHLVYALAAGWVYDRLGTEPRVRRGSKAPPWLAAIALAALAAQRRARPVPQPAPRRRVPALH